MEKTYKQIEFFLDDIGEFTEYGGDIKLRSYQSEVAERICAAVFDQKGLSFVVMFPRQSGKNELQAQIEAYLLAYLCYTPAEIVKVSPTYKPQTLNAVRCLQRVLEKNVVLAGEWEKESGYIFRVNQAHIIFLSGSLEANIVGATARMLLEVDEAQDVEISKFDKDIAARTASTHATRGRELRAARAVEAQDGIRRVFVMTAEEEGAGIW